MVHRCLQNFKFCFPSVIFGTSSEMFLLDYPCIWQLHEQQSPWRCVGIQIGVASQGEAKSFQELKAFSFWLIFFFIPKPRETKSWHTSDIYACFFLPNMVTIKVNCRLSTYTRSACRFLSFWVTATQTNGPRRNHTEHKTMFSYSVMEVIKTTFMKILTQRTSHMTLRGV